MDIKEIIFNKTITLGVIDSIFEEYNNLLEIDEDYKMVVVLRDSSFKNDIDKTNAIQKLKQLGIKEVRNFLKTNYKNNTRGGIKTVEIQIETLLKPSNLNGKEKFNIISFTLDPENIQNDWDLLEKVKGKIKKMNTNQMNTAGDIRNEETLLKDKYLGTMSEELLTCLLNKYFKKKEIPVIVKNEEFTNYEDHIDIVIEKENNEKIKIEVRGSYPYAKLENVIWQHMSILGPYTTCYKGSEKYKDIYMCVLINQAKEDFDYTKKHKILFVGGATFDLLKKIGTIKNNLKSGSAQYSTIKPISRGMDALELLSTFH